VSVVVVVTAFPVPEHRAAVIRAFEAAIKRVHDEPGVELYALHEGPDRLVMIEKYASAQARAEHRKGAVRDPASYHSRPGSRVLISWSSHPLPSGSLNEA
jgi:quinol monooxygenase YgiN